MTLVAQIAPQRSTQYAQLASTLAPYELQLSPIGRILTSIEPLTLAGKTYLKLELAAEPDLNELGMLALTTSFFWYYDHIGDQPGPFLRPLATEFKPALSPEIVMTRRYRGKTNEMFTHFLCNIARHSSDFAAEPWSNIRLCDPLAGGGTTLLTGLVLGASTIGIDQNERDVYSTVAFLNQYTKEEGIPAKVQEERIKKIGRRWRFTIDGHQLVLGLGDTLQADQFLNGFKKPHLMVADLPYGIQHQGPLVKLLTDALPMWASQLDPGGALVFSWDSTRFPRADMVKLVDSTGVLHVRNDPPYDQLTHQVDRVIKRRDIIVARLTES